jgi:hypothetical protein
MGEAKQRYALDCHRFGQAVAFSSLGANVNLISSVSTAVRKRSGCLLVQVNELCALFTEHKGDVVIGERWQGYLYEPRREWP